MRIMIVSEIIQVIASMTNTRFEFLCLAYLIGCVTAMNLQHIEKYCHY